MDDIWARDLVEAIKQAPKHRPKPSQRPATLPTVEAAIDRAEGAIIGLIRPSH
jgi:hypothetical protein